jgi:hypothetical protein
LGFEGFADFIDRMVLFTQGDDEGPGGGLFGLSAGAWAGGEEEGGLGVVAEAVAQDAEGPWGVAISAGDLLGRAALDEVSAESLVLAVFGEGGLEEEGAWVCYIEWLSDRHAYTVTYTRYGVKCKSERNPLWFGIWDRSA